MQILKICLALSFLSPFAAGAVSAPPDLAARMSAVAQSLPPIFLYRMIYNPRRNEVVAEPKCVTLRPANIQRLREYIRMHYYWNIIPAPTIDTRLMGVTDLATGRQTPVAFNLEFSYLPEPRWTGQIIRATSDGPFALPFEAPPCQRQVGSSFAVVGERGLVALDVWLANQL